jgi:hypothetical protein
MSSESFQRKFHRRSIRQSGWFDGVAGPQHRRNRRGEQDGDDQVREVGPNRIEKSSGDRADDRGEHPGECRGGNQVRQELASDDEWSNRLTRRNCDRVE